MFIPGQLVRRQQQQVGETFFLVESATASRFVGTSPTTERQEFVATDFEVVPIAPGMECRVVGAKKTFLVESISGSPAVGLRSLRLRSAKGEYHSTVESALLDLRPGPTLQDHLTQFASRGFATVLKRERVLAAKRAAQGNCRGLETLFGARVDLLEHQVSVVRSVLSFPGPRALLGDEVGLGKTIESGLILGALLKHKPDLNALIVCPGALATQWLAEIYSKFHGHVFLVPSLEDGQLPLGTKSVRMILTMSDLSSPEAQSFVAKVDWDLVIVDEAHKIPSDSRLFGSVRKLSERTAGLLLLSATPVRSRPTDFVRLLSLLNPTVFGPDDVEKLQSLRPKQSAIEDLFERTEGCTAFALPMRAKAWAEILPEDANILAWCAAMQSSATQEEKDAAESARDRLLRYVADVYRIDHRIMRNRREALRARLHLPEREYEAIPLEVTSAERRVSSLVEAWVKTLQASKQVELARLLQAEAMQRNASSARSLGALLEARLSNLESGSAPSRDLMAFAEAPLSRSELNSRLDELCAGCKPVPGEEKILLALATEVSKASKEESRIQQAIEWILGRLTATSSQKLLVFVEHPETHELLFKLLVQKLKPVRLDVASFQVTTAPHLREQAAQAFIHHPNCRVLVCDSSGGEGRNFQHADAVLHVDLPWDLGAIEQRIGRLDRIGRTKPVVIASVSSSYGVESCWARVVWQVFQLGAKSLAGLEFLAEEAQSAFRETAFDAFEDGLVELASSLVEKVASERQRLATDEERRLDLRRFDLDETRELIQELKSDAKLPGDKNSTGSEFVDWAREVGVNMTERGKAWEIDFSHLATSIPVGHQRTRITGTFERWLAKKEASIQYLAWGHPFIEWLAGTAASNASCRVAAVAVPPLKSTWRGCRISVCAEPDPELLAKVPVFLRGRVAYAARPLEEQYFVRSDGALETDRSVLASLASGLTKGLALNASRLLEDLDAHAIWKAEIDKCSRVALEAMRAGCAEDFEASAEDLEDEFGPEISTAKAIADAKGNGTAAGMDLAAYQIAVEAVKKPLVTIDSLIWIQG